MEALLKNWQSSLYMWPAAFFVTLFFALLFCIPSDRSRNIPLAIKLYLIAYGLTFIIIDGTILIRQQYDYYTYQVQHYTDYIFTIIEFVFIAYYFYTNNLNSLQKKVLTILTILFLIASLVFSFQLPRGLAVARLYTTQVLLLLNPSFFYFRNLFKSPTTIDIANTPSFWISTGITFFLLCTMSLSLIETFFLNHKPHILAKLAPIYYIFYMLMFVMFFRAYLCKLANVRV